MQNVQQTYLSQYANSAVITALIEAFNSEIDPSGDINAFYDYVWNTETAQGYGLDIWGRIVGVTRYLQVPLTGQINLGFKEGTGTGEDTFGFGAFYQGPNATQTIALPDADFRTLIYAKALTNIMNGSTQSYNALLMNLFPEMGNIYVSYGSPMAIVLVFPFVLSVNQKAIITQSGAFQPPVGVSYTISEP